MARKGENIFHRKDGRWEARYVKGYDCKGGNKYGYVYGKTYCEAKNKRIELLINLEKVKKNKEFQMNNKIILNKKIDEWLSYERPSIKLSTFSYYLSVINKHIRNTLGQLYLYQINDIVISDFINRKIDEGLKLSTVRGITVILKQILKFCDIEVKVKMPKLERKKITILSIEEKEKLQLYLQNNINEITIGILFSLYSGLRIGEVCALKWSDIDFQTNTLHIQRTVIRVNNPDYNDGLKTKLIINEAKTENSIRDIPLSDKFAKLLNIFKNSKNDNYFILTSNDRYMDPRNYYNHYKKIIKKAGINNYKYHSLRHTFATNCIELGLDPKSLSEILGHSDIKITLSLYVHPSLELKRNFINRNFICSINI